MTDIHRRALKCLAVIAVLEVIGLVALGVYFRHNRHQAKRACIWDQQSFNCSKI
jgi:hypothetical protein